MSAHQSTVGVALGDPRSFPSPHAQARGWFERVGLLGKVIRRLGLFLGLGALVNVLVAVALGLFLNMSEATSATTTGVSDQGEYWTATTFARAGGVSVAIARNKPSWCPHQVTGPPDTTTAGDHGTAWASASQDGQMEWLDLRYPRPILAKAVHIHETYNPGGVCRITTRDERGNEVDLWNGVDPLPASAQIGWSKIDIRPAAPIDRIRVYIDSVKAAGWNEIDAVALVDSNGESTYATGAAASSWYGGGGASASRIGFEELMPWWGNISSNMRDAMRDGSRSTAQIEARGWPMLSMWTEGREEGGEPVVSRNIVRSGVTISGFVLSGSPGPTSAVTPVVPYRPILMGSAVNSLLYALVLWVAWWVLTRPRWFIVEVSRMRRGCCIACGYELHYDFIRGCPECGWRRVG